MKNFLRTYGRPLLATLGLCVIAFMVMKVGPDKVWATIRGAGVWLPLILLLDISWMAVEGVGLYLLFGRERRNITFTRWVQATLVQYATFVVVPMGRASGEVARAGVLAPAVGKAQAAAAGALMQSFTLMTNGLLSLACLGFVIATTRHSGLSALLTVNVFATGVVGLLIYLVLRHVEVGGFFGKRFARLASHGPELDAHVRASRPRHLICLSFCILGRLVQTAQYGLILFAVVGAISLPFAFVAEGIQLVGRSMGDAVPNQVGVTEGAFALAAGALHLAEHPEKAISIALLGRVSNLTVAGLCALGLQLLPRRVAPAAEEQNQVA